MSLADLIAAGAPELPDGWFYRVTDDSFFGPTVEIRKRRRVGSSRCITARVRDYDFNTALAAVVDACQRACVLLDQEAEEYAKSKAVAAYFGDHDPRRTK